MSEDFELRVAISTALNRVSAENNSGTPDFILADYLIGCLEVFDKTIGARARWRGESVELPALQKLEAGSDPGEWRAGRWFRSVGPDGTLWGESSDEEEIRRMARTDDKILRLWERVSDKEQEWRLA